MNKKLFYLFAWICSISLFTACSSDDDDNTWEQLPGTYNGDKLEFYYGETLLSGQEVNFTGTSRDNLTMLFKNVIPGENETKITGIQVVNSEFTGTATTTNATVEYTGALKAEKLTVKLNVKMNDPKGWAKSYKLADYTTGEVDGSTIVMTSALYSNWDASKGNANVFPPMFRAIGGILLPQVLQTVTLEADGNITASYHKGAITIDPTAILGLVNGTPPLTPEQVKAMIPTNDWVQSPRNLAYWFVKDDKLYVKLNIPAIISQSMGNNTSELTEIISALLKGDPATIKNMLSQMSGIDFSTISDNTFKMLLDWVNNGFPMTVGNKDSRTQIYLDKTALSPLMIDPAVETTMGMDADIVKLWMRMVEAKIVPSEAFGVLILLLNFPQNWPNTTDFGLGLDLQAK